MSSTGFTAQQQQQQQNLKQELQNELTAASQNMHNFYNSKSLLNLVEYLKHALLRFEFELTSSNLLLNGIKLFQSVNTLEVVKALPILK
ncbi:hypothetical protein RR46_05634 [Papilio xuthus]|uniref:Uncharacterized protein n=1 Tax=Papilio xuthus TaxID=66420 RepID=A0A194PUL7_PAPXU|nr:hypothetical protein RR46_05634 [Papilio xuthus]